MGPTSAARRARSCRRSDAGRRPARSRTSSLIGAMKAGTTSMYHYLRAHPQVYMPTFKAPEFFAGEGAVDPRVDWYRRAVRRRRARGGRHRRGLERLHQVPELPGRARSASPSTSRTCGSLHRAGPDRPHPLALPDPGGRGYREAAPLEALVFETRIYLDYSRYAMQIEQYLEHFPREQLLVLTAEALRDDRERGGAAGLRVPRSRPGDPSRPTSTAILPERRQAGPLAAPARAEEEPEDRASRRPSGSRSWRPIVRRLDRGARSHRGGQGR